MRLLQAIIVVSSFAAFAQDHHVRNHNETAFPWLPEPSQRQGPVLKTNILGWTLEGAGYEFKCDDLLFGCGIPVFRSRTLARPEKGSFIHREWAVPWRGAVVEVRGEIRAGMVSGAAALVIRAEDASGHTLALAESPPLKGTTSFQSLEVKLLVPADAERLSVGFELTGTGALFIRGVEFDDAELLASRP